MPHLGSALQGTTGLGSLLGACYSIGVAARAHASDSQKHVTRDVAVSAVRDLLKHPPRATVAFVNGDAVDLLPARFHFSADTHCFGVLPDAGPELENREVVLVIDDGPYWFELRGISVRGTATRVEPPKKAPPRDLVWYAITPRRVLAWDYGSIREE